MSERVQVDAVRYNRLVELENAVFDFFTAPAEEDRARAVRDMMRAFNRSYMAMELEAAEGDAK